MKKIGITILSIILVSVIGFIVWTTIFYPATASYLQQIQANTGLIITQDSQHITLIPTGETKYTLVFYPGAKVDPQAYIYKLGTIALAHDIKIIIDKPLARLQMFGINNADSITGDNLIIAGHSLGGAMACEYVKNHPDKVKAMILMGAYCFNDISSLSGVSVLSFAASQDGLISMDEMKTYDHNLPADHIMSVLSGAAHAQYGNYGLQNGDGISTMSDKDVLQQISDEIGKFVGML